MVGCLWAGEREGTDLAHGGQELCAPSAQTVGSNTPRTEPTVAVGANRLWLQAHFCPTGRACPRALGICDWSQRRALDDVGARSERAQKQLQDKYQRSFRILPPLRAEHVIAEVGVAMISL